MTNLQLPAFMLAWKTSSEVVCMEEVLTSDPRRTVKGFQANKKFDRPAPKFSFDDPYKEEEEDCLSKVTCYWKAHDQERTQSESRYRELLDAEKAAALWKWTEEAARELKKAQELEKAKEKEKEKEKGKEKEKQAGLFGSAKGKVKEVPKMPKKPTPKKSHHEILSESEEGEGEDEDEDESPQSCIYCVKKKILCIPQRGKKTAWAAMEGSKKISESIWELANLEKQWEAGCLEVVWHDLRIFLIEVEQKAAVDSVAADARVLQLLELKSKGMSVPEDLEKWIWAKHGLVQQTLKENTEDLIEQMDHIWRCMVWTNNGLYGFGKDSPPVQAAVQGTKRKSDNEGDHMEGKIQQLSYFQFQPPYARDQYITLFNQFYKLIARIPIARQDTSHDMDFFAILVHREGSLEEAVMILVPASFFEDHFFPDDPSSSSPSPPPSPSSTVVPNSSLPIPPPTSVTIAEPPSTHDYPPTRHIAQQLGEARQSPSWTWKELMEELWMYIFVIG
ncbi:hypothetical protein M422DRAFT_262981 [Sphaerobolus stellatus SS14]|uniref:Uncharacterized protein n=1 Tax=Sphaerobolus stellatus (strain SS14) TaxID=990650 RepID=A0A0C9VBT6_SPHS4|nr:hypothetical protein M422DRAFT_262981 [Sphaerobolus stellatus SS14]